MAYVVVVFAMINAAALAAVGWYFREVWRELPMYVSSAIQDEIRKQDDRIEKRLAKREGTPGIEGDELPVASDGRMVAGRAYRR